MIDRILSLVLSVQFLAAIIIVIGVYALIWWLIENLKSVVQIARALMLPYFQPQEDLPLSEKFGNWAGKYSHHFVRVQLKANEIECKKEKNEIELKWNI